MHEMRKISVDEMFKQMNNKRGINMHGEQAISAMYRYYTHLDNMKIIGVLTP